jgi:hypothetical protein
MNHIDWNVVAALGSVASAIATITAVAVALFLALWPIQQERRRRQGNAHLVRTQLLAHLRLIRESLGPRSHPLDLVQREAFEPLQHLWMRADLLEAEELQPLNEAVGTLLVLRNRPTVNQRQVRWAQGLINQACMVLDQHHRKPCSKTNRYASGSSTSPFPWKVLSQDRRQPESASFGGRHEKPEPLYPAGA